ncbi:MAG: PQQ-binding-like beta-propeller repeat protein [Candidatus Bathyarchaeia archaeon]
MQKLKSKTLAILITAILTISAVGSMMTMQTAHAHSPPWLITTYAFVDASPDPCGINQQMLIFGWINQVISGALLTNNIRPQNYKFTITQPNNTTVTETFPTVSDPTSSQYFAFTPTQVGTYTVFFSYPGQTYTGTGPSPAQVGLPATSGDLYLPSNATMTFTVQQQPIPTYPENPLPTSYWTRPIYDENQAWESIASNWLAGASVSNYWQQNGAAPMTAHIMWTKPLEYGGLEGGTVTQFGNSADAVDAGATYYFGMSYNLRFSSPIIMQGVLYYQEPNGEAGSGGPEMAVSLATGQTLWSSTSFYPSFAQLDDIQLPNQYGSPGGILWVTAGSTWEAYNAFTAQALFNLTSVPSGTQAYDNMGNILIYQFSYNVNTQTGWVALWNDTAAMTSPLNGAPIGSAGAGIPEFPVGSGFSINAGAAYAYSYNVTVSAKLDGAFPSAVTSGNLAAPHIVGVIPGEFILGASSNIAIIAESNPNSNPWTMWCLSDKAGSQGQLLWLQEYPAPSGNLTQMLCTQPMDPVTNEFAMTYQETGQRLAYSLTTGNLVWGPSSIAQNGFQYYSSREGLPAYGNYYVAGYGGIVYCYSMLNGTLLWTYGNGGEGNSTGMGINGPWGNYPTHITAFADGMVFTYAGEHSPNTPLYKGEQMRVLNATTGQEIWTLSDWSASGLGTSMQPIAIADGNAVFDNDYDGQLYCVGQGPSQTTVTAPNVAAIVGTKVVIQGTVMDISPGTKQTAQAADFPNGVPCASDASMTQWMEYVYQQQAEPTNFTGVPVVVSVLDSNGNTRVIGTATTDSRGSYSISWAPDIPGNFTIYAAFPGTSAYYGSSAETHLYASAAAPTPAPTSTPASNLVTTTDLMTYMVAGVIAIIIVIVIVGLLLYRKRP